MLGESVQMPAAAGGTVSSPGTAMYGAASCGSSHRCVNGGDYQAVGMAASQTMLGGVRRFDIAAMTAGTMAQVGDGTELPLAPAAHLPTAVAVPNGVTSPGSAGGALPTATPAPVGGEGTTAATATTTPMPSRGSNINLEAMIGSSLASAINSLDHQQQQQEEAGGRGKGAYLACSSSSSSGSVSPDLPAGAPEMGFEETAQANAFGLFRLAQRGDSGSSLSPPGAPMARPPPGMGAPAPPPAPGLPIPQQQPQPQHVLPPRSMPYSMPFPHAPAGSPPSSYASPSPPTYVSGIPASDGVTSPPFAADSPRPTVLPAPGGGGRGALFETSTGIELVQFLLETESRALILFNVDTLPSELLLLACEKMGSMSYFRADFRACRGVAFVAYNDLRAAIRAYHTLGRELAAALGPQAGEQRGVMVHYSIMLNAAQTPRDGILLVRDASQTLSESDVQAVFSSYGQLKNVHKRMGMGFLVEYYDTQDAKLAAYELSSSTPWGPAVAVEEAERAEKERQLGQQLLLTLHRWREEQRQASFATMTVGGAHGEGQSQGQGQGVEEGPASSCGSGTPCHCCCYGGSPQQSPGNLSPPQLMYLKAASYPGLSHSHAGSNTSTPTYMAYPTGSYAVPQGAYAAHVLEGLPGQLDETGLCGGFKGMWVTPHHMGVSPKGACAGRSPLTAHYAGARRGGRLPGGPMMGGPMGSSCPTGDPEYQLDIDRVLKGLDKRTTIMIRNIPNKYTQALLLNEINVNHKGKYDFFYLPIDFKNKCNVGYAFINFIDYRSIVAFFREFNGQRWKNFNSEKVCAISYARIQGKQSMISRFQNSSLMEKDGEYRPLLFHSNGLDRGKPEPFPMSSKHRPRGSTPPTPTSLTNLMFGLGLGLGM